MRTSLVIGASSLRRLAAGALAAVLLATGLAALGAAPASALASTGGNGHRDGHVGARWDGGSARSGGVEYSWAPHTFDYVGDTCPDLDSGKIDLKRESATVEISAPQGMLISSYCIKSGSDRSGEGPKVVKLDVPVARLTIAYPVDGKCKSISHYAVEYVAAQPRSAAKPPVAETPSPEGSEAPAASVPAAPPAAAPIRTAPTPAAPQAPASEGTTPAEAADDEEPGVRTPGAASGGATSGGEARAVVATVPTSTPTPTTTPTPNPAPSASAVAVPGDDTTPSAALGAARLAATDEGPAVQARGRLAFTGAQVVGILAAAVVLVTVGTLAVHSARRRAGVDA